MFVIRQLSWQNTASDMPLMVSFPCGTCGEPIFSGVDSCPHCGAANSPNVGLMARRLLVVLGALIGLGLLTLLCAPQTKTLDCTLASKGSHGARGEAAGDVDTVADTIERFSIDKGTKQIVFPGVKEIKEERVPYSLSGDLLSFEDRFGVMFELNLKTGSLRKFVKSGPEKRSRHVKTYKCTGI